MTTERVYPVRINWRLILEDLSGAGVSGYRVAKELEVERSTVQGWASAAGDIGYGNGRALLALSMAHCGQILTFDRINTAQRIVKKQKAA